jgi:hypothetical protein
MDLGLSTVLCVWGAKLPPTVFCFATLAGLARYAVQFTATKKII